MSSEMSEAISQLVNEKGISEEHVLKMIEDTLKAAYKRKFGRNDNAEVKFSDDRSEVSIYSKKTVVDGVYDPLTEIELEEALDLDPECEEGDELLIEVNPKEFDMISVQSGKQTARQSVRDIQKNSLYADFKEKEGKVVIGYCQRRHKDNGSFYVNLGKAEGILPRKYQSPRETYAIGEKIKVYVQEVEKTPSGVRILLSRTTKELVQEILELEIPEVYDKTVEIYKIVREPGYRTKVAVFSNREDVDPVGACIGANGSRIQNVREELSGEKVDIVRYDSDPREFIKNALSPAEVDDVVIVSSARRAACAIVSERQFSLALGKEGRNVRLANRLVDWNIDIKTREEFAEMDISAEPRRAIDSLFSGFQDEQEAPSVPAELTALLQGAGIQSIEEALRLGRDELFNIEGMTDEFRRVLDKMLDSAEEREQGTGELAKEEFAEDEEFVCPECGERITIDMTSCPSCGVELSFEYEDEEDGE